MSGKDHFCSSLNWDAKNSHTKHNNHELLLMNGCRPELLFKREGLNLLLNEVRCCDSSSHTSGVRVC